jgi:hypothetical protein
MKYKLSILTISLTCCGLASCSLNNFSTTGNETTIFSTKSAKSEIELVSMVHQRNPSRSLVLSSTIVPPAAFSSNESEDRLHREFQGSSEQTILNKFARDAKTKKSWQEVDILARGCMEQTRSSIHGFRINQFVATTMLTTYFLLLELTPEVQKAVGYYMDVLAGHNNYYDLNKKTPILTMLIGYWSKDKITAYAQKIFENNGRSKLSPVLCIERYLSKRGNELLSEIPNTYKSLTEKQINSKVYEELRVAVLTYPKRTKPYPTIVDDYEEYNKNYTDDKPENIAILALLIQGHGEIPSIEASK